LLKAIVLVLLVLLSLFFPSMVRAGSPQTVGVSVTISPTIHVSGSHVTTNKPVKVMVQKGLLTVVPL
jgi:hypothetical protein